jgi:hypothetical protein
MNNIKIKLKTSELTGAALDWAVAKCEGRKPSCYTGIVRATAHPDFPDSPPIFGPELNYSADWALAGPIIEREKICIWGDGDLYWEAECGWAWAKGSTPLIAAMRCYVTLKLGDEVEVPEELKGVTA